MNKDNSNQVALKSQSQTGKTDKLHFKINYYLINVQIIKCLIPSCTMSYSEVLSEEEKKINLSYREVKK